MISASAPSILCRRRLNISEPDASASAPAVNRAPFDEAMCEIVEDLVSFQFGLPEKPLLGRVKAAGCRVLDAATTVEEARWLSS